MNNKIIILTTLVSIMVIVGISDQNASAMTNMERYNAGWNAVINSHNDKQFQLNIIGSGKFSDHSEAYKNGFIGAFDHEYGLSLPYVAYHTDGAITDPNAKVTIIPHYMGIDISNH